MRLTANGFLLIACIFLPVTALSTVTVKVEQSLPGVTPRHAKDAWMSFQWRHGGGLPILVSQKNEQTRRLMPIGMEETLLEQSDEMIRYEVTDMGLFSSELAGSHSAQVRFMGNKDGTTMIWNVEFEATHRADLWKAVTEVNIRTVSANLCSYVAIPRLYRRTTRFPAKYDSLPKTWVDFVWHKGGGLPVPPILRLDADKRMIVPPFLVERLVNVEEKEIRYTVDNPGLLTYPVHTHAGRVRFQNHSSGGMEMIWEVELRPLRGWSWFVEHFTSTIITVLARNFKVHVTEPGAMVKLAPPRGKGEAFGEVPKDTWLGGVLVAHLSDRRSTAGADNGHISTVDVGSKHRRRRRRRRVDDRIHVGLGRDKPSWAAWAMVCYIGCDGVGGLVPCIRMIQARGVVSSGPLSASSEQQYRRGKKYMILTNDIRIALLAVPASNHLTTVYGTDCSSSFSTTEESTAWKYFQRAHSFHVVGYFAKAASTAPRGINTILVKLSKCK